MFTRKQRKHKLKKKNKKSRKSRKSRKQRGGGFFEFIPSPVTDLTRQVLTGFKNFTNQFYGLPLESSHAPFRQSRQQI